MKGVRRALGVLLAVAAWVAVPEPGAAQSTEELIGQRRVEYEYAVSAHQTAVAAWNLIDRQFLAALDQNARAARAGDDAARSQALSDAQALLAPLADSRNRVDAAANDLRSARQRFIDVLLVRQVELIELADAAPSAQQRRNVDIRLRDLSNELAALEAEVENDLDLGPVAMPDISIDPRDGPADILGKAEILERTAARVDTLILRTDQNIEALEARRDTERRQRDLFASVGRFGDLRPPTGTSTGGDPLAQAADSTGAGGRPLTLGERIEAMRVYRQQLVDQRDLYLDRARDFQARVRRRS